MEKHSVSRLSYLFAHLYLLSSYSFSSDLLSSNLPLLSASALLCFSSVHIVGSLTSKLPSTRGYTHLKNIGLETIFPLNTHSQGFPGYPRWITRKFHGTHPVLFPLARLEVGVQLFGIQDEEMKGDAGRWFYSGCGCWVVVDFQGMFFHQKTWFSLI